MSSPLLARLAYQTSETAAVLRQAAEEIDLLVTSEIDISARALDVTECRLLLLEQRDAIDALMPRMYSITGANPDLIVIVIVPHPRVQLEAGLLRAGAFDVVDDGPEMKAHLLRAFTTARRVIALQDERSKLNADLAHQDKLAALGLLAAGVSHEVNNPCGAILANMTAMREDLESLLALPRFQQVDVLEANAPDWLEATGDCISAARRIHAIVKTLNVFSRRTETSEPSAVDINEEISTVLRLIGKEVKFQAQFSVALAPDLPRVLVPPTTITQTMTNLVVNALQALEKRSPSERRIRISTRYDQEHVMIEVEDNGPGIDPEILGRIFDPFFTTKPVGKGTGLGLSITRGLIERAGGEIFVDSTVGQGARFLLVFPRSKSVPIAAKQAAPVLPSYGRLRVMIVDDDEVTLRSIQRSLASKFECIMHSGGNTALADLRSDDKVDVVLSDIVMPDMNGVEFYQQLIEEHPQLAARIAFLSGGITSEGLRKRVVETGRPLLGKPLDMEELVTTIRALSENFEQRFSR